MIYFRADGGRIDIDVQAKDFLMAYWIEWLGAYILNASSARSVGEHKVFPLMKPDGRVIAIPFLGRWTPNYVRPTRAGMVGTIGSAQYNGVFLMRDGKIVQLADGRVHPQVVVSPDGCHVAYIAEIPSLFSFQIAYRRLRVLDVCASLDIPPTSNPFVWPTEANPTSSEK